jgi:hypothetical protein
MASNHNGVELLDALAIYTQAVLDSAEKTHRAEDRSIYVKHLVAAARMFVALRRDRTLEELRAIVALERRNYGLGFLSNDEGSYAEVAFVRFAKLVESD